MHKMNKFMFTVLAFPVLALQVGCSIVDTGQVGIEKRFGEVRGGLLDPGLHFYNIFTSKIIDFDVRERKLEDKTACFTRDTQNSVISYTLTYFPAKEKVMEIYVKLGLNWEDKIILPVVRGNMKTVTGQYVADELVGKREMVRQNALKSIRAILEERGIVVTNLELTNIDFDDNYERAVEAKSVAVQKAAEAKNKTVEIEEQARQKVIEAKAEAESTRIRTSALEKSKELIQLEAVRKWDGKLPQYMMSGSTLPFLEIGKK
jgi:regulator of protease activity HflC (stomatin/prohibitin superfamily)